MYAVDHYFLIIFIHKIDHFHPPAHRDLNYYIIPFLKKIIKKAWKVHARVKPNPRRHRPIFFGSRGRGAHINPNYY